MKLLVTGARAPVALQLLRLFKEAGHTVYLTDSLQRPLASASRLHDGFFVVPPLRSAQAAAADALGDLLDRLQIDLVIPTCEDILHLAKIWQLRPMSAPLFAPDFDLLADVHHKFNFIQLCRRLALAVPETQLLQSRSEVEALAKDAHRLVFKPVWSRFATMTVIRPKPQQLGPIAPTSRFAWVAQEFVQGDELCVYAVAREGRVRALSAYRGLIRAGAGAAICFEPVQDPAVARFVQDFAAGTRWTGQVSFDMIRRPDGTVVPIECNPRATSGVHFFRAAGAFSAACFGAGDALPDVQTPKGVRLALWLYGLPQVMRPGGWARFRHAVAQVEDIMDWPGDRLGLWDQLRPLGEIARIARQQGTSLLAASTYDIEWDGADQSKIS